MIRDEGGNLRLTFVERPRGGVIIMMDGSGKTKNLHRDKLLEKLKACIRRYMTPIYYSSETTSISMSKQQLTTCV